LNLSGSEAACIPPFAVFYGANTAGMIARFLFCLLFFHSALMAQQPAMYFSDSSGTGIALAKDPVVVKHEGRYLLYYSRKIKNDQRDGMQGWGIGIAESQDLTNWKKVGEINPETDYERKGLCDNNMPQQIGIAVSKDGISWKRLSELPFLPNGQPGSWNSSESGHPCNFEDNDGRTYLFFQGNRDNGRSWYLSKKEIRWNKQGPFLAD
jgi:hypothetical protein